ncbi:MAG: VOC family protein [Acidimicrobiales bacterium]|nr:VOC family protein [Acidimicrobiales bacterium]
MADQPSLGPVNGVLIWTSAERYPALAAFYRDTLRLPVRTDRPGHLAIEWPDGMRLTLGIHTELAGAGPAADPLRIMINLAVTDILAVAAGLRARGVRFTREPSPEPWGGWIATFRDPDGNIVQLLQPSPA